MGILVKEPLKFITGQVGNPTDRVENFFLDHDFECVRLNIHTIQGVYDGAWVQYITSASWRPKEQVLEIYTKFMPSFKSSKGKALKELIEELNPFVSFGAFCYVQDPLVFFHLYRLLVLEASDDGELITRILQVIFDSLDRYYPAFDAVLTGQLSGQEAASLVKLQPLGNG